LPGTAVQSRLDLSLAETDVDLLFPDKMKTSMQTTKAIFRITTQRTSQAGEIAVNKGVDRLKMCIKHLSPLPALIACLVLMVAGPVTAQTFTTLHSFTAAIGHTNTDGIYPQAGLILSGNTLYGTAYWGGRTGNGTMFAVNINGTGFTNLYSFTGGSDGAEPAAGLILSGNTLYGTAEFGGSSGNGTVFSISLLAPPQLMITPSGDNVVLTWPTNATGFILEFATNLVSPTVWNTNSTAPVIINGQNTVTNPITGALQFFRLSK
jgi:uncharacterized repeat protein (TIGR03803 family)